MTMTVIKRMCVCVCVWDGLSGGSVLKKPERRGRCVVIVVVERLWVPTFFFCYYLHQLYDAPMVRNQETGLAGSQKKSNI